MNKLTLGIVSLCLVAFVAIGAFAMPRFGQSDDIRDAIQAGDYDAWKSAVEAQHQKRMAEMTEEKFNEMVEHHVAMAQKRADRDASRDALHAAIEAEDFAAWKAAVGEGPMADLVTEQNFATFIAMHKARESGDFETANQLSDELGFEHKGMMRGHGEMMPGPRRGMGRGMRVHAE